MWFIIYSNNVEKYQPFLENCKFKIHDFTFYGTLRDSWVMDSGVRDEGFGLRSNFNTDILRWVMVMFAFRMVMVARVGDQVYSDEQEYFYCNTNTPGCNQVCPPYNITRKMLTMLFRCVLVIFHQ